MRQVSILAPVSTAFQNLRVAHAAESHLHKGLAGIDRGNLEAGELQRPTRFDENRCGGSQTPLARIGKGGTVQLQRFVYDVSNGEAEAFT